MANMKELANSMKKLEDQLLVCVKCGACQAVCPVYSVTRKEADVARGKFALFEGLIDNMFEDPDGVKKRLDHCLLCGSCADSCPSNVNAVEIFIRTRSILAEYKGLSLPNKIILRKLLSNPDFFNKIVGWAQKFQRMFVKPEKNTQATSCARLGTPFFKDRHIKIASSSFFHKLSDLDTGKNNTGPVVLFFTGCLIDKILVDIAISSVKAMVYHNFKVLLIEKQGCCGIPALSAGDNKSFQKLIAYHKDLFNNYEFDYLVTSCATCTSVIKKLWISLYEDKDDVSYFKLIDISNKTLDISQLLINVAKANDANINNIDFKKEYIKKVAYHDPCHLKKSLGIFKEPRKLLKAAGAELVEIEDSDKCCGMGGSFNLKYYNISSEIGNIKAKNIMDTKCGLATTSCPACILQISDMLAKQKAKIKVKHPIQLYAQSLKGDLKIES